jgi:hypothetical protein
MRKVLAVLIAVSLLGIGPAQAATKPGGKCTKAGATVNSAGKKFTCIRSGGKLVWNKGVAIKKSSAIKAGVCPPKAAADKDPGITQVRANALISMTEAAAEECAMNLGWTYRLGQRDEEMFAGTFDYRTDRVTVTVMKGLVTQVNVG